MKKTGNPRKNKKLISCIIGIVLMLSAFPAFADGGTITITKQWHDGKTGAAANNREAPVVRLVGVKKTVKYKYAVSLYGIGTDTDENGDTMGLTFGPATGANYVQSYKSHTPSGNTTAGNAHRCLHNDDWATIISWNDTDPNVYEQCITEGCTHSVLLDSSKTTTVMNRSYDVSTETGDGPSQLYYELMQTSSNYENLRWHPNNNMPNNTWSYGTNYGGWGATRIRAMLNGADSLTDIGDGTAPKDGGTDIYASSASSDVNKSAAIYTSSNCLLAAFPSELQSAIGKRETKYDSVYNSKTAANLKTSYDKLWLFSPNEIWSTSQNTDSYYTHPLEGTQYPYMATKTSGITSSTASQDGTKGYSAAGSQTAAGTGSASIWWLRSSCSNNGHYALRVSSDGGVINNNAGRNYGVAPGFSLSR